MTVMITHFLLLAFFAPSGPKFPCLPNGVKAGDIVLMRPLLVHASSASNAPMHRRVVHIEYATCELPGDLQWAEPD